MIKKNIFLADKEDVLEKVSQFKIEKEFLVEKIEKGEYDLDLLSETEKEQIELFLKNQN